MHRSRRFRLSALLAGVAVAASALMPALPAAAEEPPTPDPAVTSDPVDTPTPDPTETPSPDATDAPLVEPTAQPTPDAIPVEPPTAGPPSPLTTTPAPGGVEYPGTFAGVPNESGGGSDGRLGLFQVDGYGFLAVDSAGLSPTETVGTRVVSFAIPDGVALTGTAHARFDQLASASAKHPLTILSIRVGLSLGKQTAALVNQSPSVAAVQRIYAVLVSPNNKPKRSNQTKAKVQASVNYADAYWNQQSGGTIRFSLAGTTTWYQSGNSCKTDAGTFALWKKAASVAKSQLGYVAGKNNHLVLFFPDNQDCDGTVGLATIGDSVNTGGLAWVIGTERPVEKATLAHELGHNLSLGHADWLDCADAAPVGGLFGFDGQDGAAPGATNCSKKPYGDATDVMGFGIVNHDGGALSSPQAIRAGIWPNSAWTTATGTGAAQTFVLQPVSGNTGLRAVVVQDDDGVNYFVEYRNLTDEDAQFAPGACGSQVCVAGSPGVRVLRLENDRYKFNPDGFDLDFQGFLGFPGDDSFLIGRNDGTDKVNFTAVDDTFWTKGATGVKIRVAAISGTQATVEITKSAQQATGETALRVYPSTSYDSRMRVGDTWTALVGANWDAESTTFQWFRSGLPNVVGSMIPGATHQNYTLTGVDQGNFLSVRIQGQNTIGSPVTATYPPIPYGLGPILTGVYGRDDPGKVTIDNSASPLHAVPSGWPTDFSEVPTFTFQWYRGSSSSTATKPISGETSEYHALSAADAGKFLRVRVTARIPGFVGTTVRYSPAKNYTIVQSGGRPLLSSTRKIGTVITADTSAFVYKDAAGAVITPSISQQWTRSGVPIPGATADNYTLSSADFGKKIRFRVTATKPGFVGSVVTSKPIVPTVKGDFAIAGTPVVDTPASRTLSVAPSATADVNPDASSVTIQWYRGSKRIAGATKATYRLTSADVGTTVRAKITYHRGGYNDRSQFADPGTGKTSKWYLSDSDGVPELEGDPAVGQTLSVAAHDYVDEHTGFGFCPSGCLTFAYQWLRDGKKITTTDASDDDDYTLTAADNGKAISVTVTVSSTIPYLLPSKATSAKTFLIRANFFSDWLDPATVTQSGAVLTAASGIDDPLATTTYQWYRGTTPLSNKTKKTYTLTDADHDRPVWVAVKSKRTSYTTAVTSSAPVYYGLFGPTDPYGVKPVGGNFGDPIHVGDVVTTTRPSAADNTFFNHDHSFSWLESSVTRTYEWYRSGVRITGLNPALQDYTLRKADIGKTISVKIRVHVGGQVDYVRTSRTLNPFQKVRPAP